MAGSSVSFWPTCQGLPQNILTRQHFNTHFALCCMTLYFFFFNHREMWKGLPKCIKRRDVPIWKYIIWIWTGAVIQSANFYMTITHPVVCFCPLPVNSCPASGLHENSNTNSLQIFFSKWAERLWFQNAAFFYTSVGQPVRNLFHTKLLFFLRFDWHTVYSKCMAVRRGRKSLFMLSHSNANVSER